MFLDFVCNIAELLKLDEISQLCELLQFENYVKNQISRSTFPGLEFTIVCRRRQILNSTNISKLQDAFDTFGMAHLSTITKEYMEMLSNPGTCESFISLYVPSSDKCGARICPTGGQTPRRCGSDLKPRQSRCRRRVGYGDLKNTFILYHAVLGYILHNIYIY